MSSSRKIWRLERVERVVGGQHRLGQRHVAADERVEGVAQHLLRELAHARDVDQRLDRRVLQVALAGLGDVDGQVADPLEVGVDLDGGDDDAQVGGHRLVQRQQLEAAVVDFDVEVVDRLVAGQHRVERARGRAPSGRAPTSRTRSSASPPMASSRSFSASSSS